MAEEPATAPGYASTMDDEPKPVEVRRFEPPPDDDDAPPARPRAKLTPEEARALLAVTVPPKGPWDKVKPRLRIAFVVTTVLGLVASLALEHGLLANLVIVAAGGAWVAWPLVFAGRDDWDA